ncbi:MAG: oxygen-independent coproporphyrinogen III oxidase [Alphaproteobacteria bacterium]|nr:oxygen-independent coproporphyrinogen III oxidase [Alphaproteobacteria bacterium]
MNSHALVKDSWLSHLDARVPRYTSYPTAPHFHKGVTAATVNSWLERTDMSEPLSLYLHIPFCSKLCWYCGCNTTITKTYAPVRPYLETMLAELSLIVERLPGRGRLSHLHFGGGTPSLLSPDDFHRVMDAIAKHFDFVDRSEISIEIDPRGFTASRAKAYGEAGVTRASIGVQDFDTEVQKAIHRIQPYEMVAKTVEALRKNGVMPVNFDLIYGLPYQTEKSITESVHATVKLGANRVALFGYAHVPWMKKYQKALERHGLPDMRARLRLALAAREVLEDHYVPIGLDHFALSGDPMTLALNDRQLRRNFQGYTTDSASTLIAIGPSAISATGWGYAQNESDLDLWSQSIAEGRLPVHRGLVLSADDLLRREVIEKLMCDMQVDLESVATHHGVDPAVFFDDLDRLQTLEREGLAIVKEWIVTIPAEARLAMRSVASVFDAWLSSGQGRHAAAV